MLSLLVMNRHAPSASITSSSSMVPLASRTGGMQA